MNGLLHVDGADTRGLWRVIFAHTESVGATAQILRELTDAREKGPVGRCSIVPPEAPDSSGRQDGRWTLRVSRAPRRRGGPAAS